MTDNRRIGWPVAGAVALAIVLCVAEATQAAKTCSTFYPRHVAATVRASADRTDWGRACRDAAIAAAQPWVAMSDDDLWQLMFGPGVTRSWMVWSNGHCPACRKGVPMYNWGVDAVNRPWKVQCPHCDQLFPTNDFGAYYRSGLNAKGIFDRSLANRSLLFNSWHPAPDDPLRQFGVDDGEGYREGDKRWRFIGAYLIYGQWKQAVLQGIRDLAAAHLLTGEAIYAHKAGILLDRVADVWPEFDFKSQAVVYERRLGSNGYVSTWHDACLEVRQIAKAYDMVFEAIREDQALVTFLSGKAARHGLENRKSSFADIQRNVEQRLLRDTLRNKHKILSNYPQQEITLATILSVLGPEANRQVINAIVEPMLKKATAVDGLTGEKGLANYTAGAITALARFLREMDRSDPEFLSRTLGKIPNLKKTYRFHIDTHCLGRYYPLSGDTGSFAGPIPRYVGMSLSGPSASGWGAVQPSSYTLLWRLYELTREVAYVQTMVQANGGRVDGLPYDLYVRDGDLIRRKIAAIIECHGDRPDVASVNFRDWHLAILRSGTGDNARALWIDYDSNERHSHRDGMNLGLFAYGLDLMPDFGYPPVQFGGWDSPRARWYTMSAAHNTVVVDGENSESHAGKTTLWAAGKQFHAVRASGPALNRGRRFERTAVLIDRSSDAFYVVDLFRVDGGTEHTKFMQSHFGTVKTEGLTLVSGGEYGHKTQMRSFRWDLGPAAGWSAEWQIEDRYGLLPKGRQVRVRYTDLTDSVDVGLAEGWVVAGSFNGVNETWIPRLLVRRRKGDAGEAQLLRSTFVAIIDPYADQPTVRAARRLPIKSAAGKGLAATHVALSITLADGTRDVVILQDPDAKPLAGSVVIEMDPEIRTDAEVAIVRVAPDGLVAYVAIAKGTYLRCGGNEITVPEGTEFIERFLSK
jgi:hypothetical protein